MLKGLEPIRPRQIQSGQIVLGFILGEAYKNLEFCLDLVIYLSAKYTVMLKILGSPDEALKSSLKVGEKIASVEFHNGLTKLELVDYYRSLDAFLFPSEIEGLGMPFVEGMMVGIPVFASAIPVLEEITNQKYPTFSNKDPAEIDKFLALFWDDKRGKTLLKSGRECAMQFDWKPAGNVPFKFITHCCNFPAIWSSTPLKVLENLPENKSLTEVSCEKSTNYGHNGQDGSYLAGCLSQGI